MAERVTLLTGAARSGKSALAERIVQESGLAPFYVATGRAWDDEMTERIGRHQDRRGEKWTTVEAPLDLVPALREHCRSDRAVLIDCLTLWVTNLMMDDRDIEREGQLLADTLPTVPGRIVIVTNEVGLGIVPENAMARAFRDHAGCLAQTIAAVADDVLFVAAGLPLKLKG